MVDVPTMTPKQAAQHYAEVVTCDPSEAEALSAHAEADRRRAERLRRLLEFTCARVHVSADCVKLTLALGDASELATYEAARDELSARRHIAASGALRITRARA